MEEDREMGQELATNTTMEAPRSGSGSLRQIELSLLRERAAKFAKTNDKKVEDPPKESCQKKRS